MAYTARSAGGSARTQTAMSDINVTPLVDVVLVLLLIFMLTAPVLQSGIEVAIPHTRSTAVLTEERVVVTIDKQAKRLPAIPRRRFEPVNVANLATLLQSSQHSEKNPAKRVVYVRADERVPFGAFATVMDSVKRAGITNISIVTQPYEK